MKFYSDEEKQSILQAKRNEAFSATEIDSFTDAEKRRELVTEVYYDSSYVVDYLIKFMEATESPKYVELARILSELRRAEQCSIVEKSREQALFVVNPKYDSGFGKGKKLRTTFKEFRQIGERHEKFSKKILRKVNKYKDVKQFYNDVKRRSDLYNDLFEKFGNASLDSIDMQRAAVYFLDQHESLSFVHSNRRLKRL